MKSIQLSNLSFSNDITFKVIANQLLDKGKVHYVNLSSDINRFDGLLPDCHYYGDREAFSSLLTNLVIDLEKRLSLNKNKRSLDNYPYVSVVVRDLQCDSLRQSLRSTLAPYFNYGRAIKYSFVVEGY